MTALQVLRNARRDAKEDRCGLTGQKRLDNLALAADAVLLALEIYMRDGSGRRSGGGCSGLHTQREIRRACAPRVVIRFAENVEKRISFEKKKKPRAGTRAHRRRSSASVGLSMLMFAHLASAAFIASRSALLPTPATQPPLRCRHG